MHVAMDHFSKEDKRMRSELVTHLPIAVDSSSSQPLPVQITSHIRSLVSQKIIAPGDHIPSSRSLAAQLGVSRGTVLAAYEQLSAEGYLLAAHGSGTMINPHLAALQPPPPPISHTSHPPSSPPLLNLEPGIPDTATLADSSWRASWRAACSTPPAASDPLGLPQLRAEISEHLRRMRGLIADPEHIVVTAGAREGLSLLLTASQRRLTIGVESPGYPSLRRIPHALGHHTSNVTTDKQGLNPDSLHKGLDAVLVTPSHQYPHGGSLSATRRTALSAWASDTDSLIIEDDFDSELRYVGMPLPALTAINPEHAVLLGTFSSVIAPQVATGYIVAPPHMISVLRNLRTALGQPVSMITQDAIARYLATGALRRRTQRLRRIYRRRREMVSTQLGHLSSSELHPIDGGLHAVLSCQRPEAEIITDCANRGIHVVGLSNYWGGTDRNITPGANHDNGIVFGFGCHDDNTLREALDILAEIVQ